MWAVSQILLVLYYKLDNGANTCGIDFHFANDQKVVDVEVNENEESIPLNPRSSSTSRVETEDAPEESSSSAEDESKSVITDEEPRGDNFFELKVLEKLCISESSTVAKLFISEFRVVSEEGR